MGVISLAKRKSIKAKIIKYFLGIMILVTFLIIFVSVNGARAKLLESQESKATIVASNLALACGDPMMVGEWDRLEQILMGVKSSDKDVKYAILLGNDGKCVAASEKEIKDKFINKTDFEKKALDVKELQRRENPNEKDVFEIVSPVITAGQRMGTLRLGYSTKLIAASIQNNITVSTLIGILALIGGSLIYYFMVQRGVVGPLNKLIVVSQPLSMGDLTQKVDIVTGDELENLAGSFNKISDSMHGMILQVRNNAEKVASSSQEMSTSIQQVNASTQEVSNAITQVSKGTVVQSERLEETFGIMERAAVSLKQVVTNAQTAAGAIEETSQRAESGRIDAQETAGKIEQLVQTVLETTKVIQGLGQMSQQIGEITETITSIADQTNLLALNAAIEAARAGEAGRGFAVVAEEVRKLAEGSAEAVRKIGSLIKSIQAETGHAVNAIQASSKEVQESKGQVFRITESLIEINKMAKEASGHAQQIAITGKERVDEVERVVKAINEVATISKESASTVQEITSSTEEQTASMEEMTASAQELAHLAIELKDSVGRFKLRER